MKQKKWDVFLEAPTELKSKSRTFLLASEDMCLHVIETGYSDVEEKYLVVYEDAYRSLVGKTEMMSKKSLKEKYKIIL